MKFLKKLYSKYLVRKWRKNDLEFKGIMSETYYRIWEMGYFAGKLGHRADESWKQVESMLGIKFPLSGRLKGADEKGRVRGASVKESG